MFPPGAGHLLPRCVLSYRSISRFRHIDWFVALPGMIYLAARRLLQLALKSPQVLGMVLAEILYLGLRFARIRTSVRRYRVYLTGGFKKPRELTWLTGVGLSVCTVSFGVTGYPFDQVSYWAIRIVTGVPDSFPLVGPLISPFCVVVHLTGRSSSLPRCGPFSGFILRRSVEIE